VEDEDENSGSQSGSESHLPDSIETRKRKRDPTNDIDLKCAFRRLTLTSKAPWLDLEEPVYHFADLQDVEVDVNIDDSSGSDAETPDSGDFEAANTDDLMTFEWDYTQDIKTPDSMNTEPSNSINVTLPPILPPILPLILPLILPPIQTIQRTHYTPKRPHGLVRTSRIWTCVSTRQM
jgi:hypothetical protein